MNNTFGHDQIDAELMKLHDALAARRAAEPRVFTNLEGEARRQYFSNARKRNRAREKSAVAAGNIPPTAANTREALADAALMILATDAPGADQVRKVLTSIFASRPGAPLSIETKAKQGKLRPRLALGEHSKERNQ